jgi:hypothetical protein
MLLDSELDKKEESAALFTILKLSRINNSFCKDIVEYVFDAISSPNRSIH